MTLDRPSADEEDAEAVATLRVQLARDCDEDPQGDVASYAPLRAYHGLEERDPVRRPRGAGKAEAAREWLTARLEAGPALVADLLREGAAEGFSRATVYRARLASGQPSAPYPSNGRGGSRDPPTSQSQSQPYGVRR